MQVDYPMDVIWEKLASPIDDILTPTSLQKQDFNSFFKRISKMNFGQTRDHPRGIQESATVDEG